MKATSITISCNIPIVLDRNRTLRPFFSISAELEEGDDLATCREELHKEALKLWVESAIKEIKLMRSMRAVAEDGDYSTPETLCLAQVKQLLSDLG